MCTRLQLPVHHYAAAGQSITGIPTRPWLVDTELYTEKGMTCSTAWACLTKHMKALNMCSGQYVHFTWRGSMICKQQ